ncbi:hypothetical protein ACFQZV_13095 [Microbacterium koreense]|uniref:ABC transporter permease n=1 Tax=Microbacterium koreense TaxID=323761 RepID=A0ABW2ZUU4_9MICO
MTTATRQGILAVVVAVGLAIVGVSVAVAMGDAREAFAGSTAATPWAARVLLALALAWVLIGMLAARTRLVRRPGAAAARASWIASTRPWRARESTLGMLTFDRVLLLVVPGGLLVATRAVQTSFLSWTHLAIVLVAWAAFLAVARVLIGRASPYPFVAAVGGAVVLRCILSLVVMSFADPAAALAALWATPVVRVVYIAAAFTLFVWVFVAAGWAVGAHLGARRAVGVVIAAMGAGLALPATIVAAIGVDRVVGGGVDEVGLLSWVLARAFGVMDALDLPGAAPWYAVGLGIALVIVGLVLVRVSPRVR